MSDENEQMTRELRLRAVFIGERLELRAFESTERLAVSPLTIQAGERGYAVLFRYGVVVLFGLTPIEEVAFLDQLKPLVRQPYSTPETEETRVRVDAAGSEGVAGDTITVPELTVERLQAIADVIAKSVILGFWERDVSSVFERIEPLAVGLQSHGSAPRQSRELVTYVGGALLTQHRSVGHVAVLEKPEVLWEHPELERLYNRLTSEYELRERQLALQNKLELVATTAETLLDLLQNKRSLRVEWYIVILIVVEILLTLYELFLH